MYLEGQNTLPILEESLKSLSILLKENDGIFKSLDQLFKELRNIMMGEKVCS